MVVPALSIFCSTALLVAWEPGELCSRGPIAGELGNPSAVPKSEVASPAAARAALVVPGHIEAVAASEAGVVTVSDHVVRVFDAHGYQKRKLWSLVGAPAHIRRAATQDGFAPLPGLTADSDWTDPIDPDELDDPDDPRVADETEIRAWDLDENHDRAKSPPLSVLRQPEVVAVAGTKAWVGRPDGLWRVDLDDGLAVRTLLESASEISALGASTGPAGETVAIIRGHHLLRSRDGGETFESATALESAPRALAVTPDGTILLVDDDGLQVSPPDRSDLERLALARAVDVASCGTKVIALAGADLFAVVGGTEGWRVERVGAAPNGAKRIVCGSDSPLWVAYGEGLWTSDDHGQSWRARTDLPPAPIASASMSDMALWVATSSGLWRLGLSATEPDNTSQARPLDLRAPPSAVGLSTLPWRWWSAALPRVDFLLAAARTASRRDLRALVVLTFILERPTSALWRGAAVAADLRHKSLAADATSAVCSRTSTVLSTDPVTADERHALAQALEDRP